MASVWGELKRRNVVRVALAYAVFSWLLLQLADVLIPLLGLPDWAGKLVFLLLALGFPLALFFAWAYELTDHNCYGSQTGFPDHRRTRYCRRIFCLGQVFGGPHCA